MNAALQVLPFRPHQIITPFGRIHYPNGRCRLVLHQPSPPSCRRSRLRDRLSRPRSRRRLVPAGLCRRLITSRRHRLVAGCSRPAGLCRHRSAGLFHLRFSSTYHLFNVLHIRHVGRKIAQCSPNKDADVDSNIQHRQVALKNHCS